MGSKGMHWGNENPADWSDATIDTDATINKASVKATKEGATHYGCGLAFDALKEATV